tara:strand:- start:338 stop:592 length:255 start_codon:yes stop_codon:yes gene_type:complete
MAEQMSSEDAPIVNEITVGKKQGIGDNILGINYVKIDVGGLIQHHWKVSLFPFGVALITVPRQQLILEFILFNKIALAVTFSLK